MVKVTNNELDKNNFDLFQFKNAITETSIFSTTDLKGNITYANENFAGLSGYKINELIINRITKCLLERSREVFCLFSVKKRSRLRSTRQINTRINFCIVQRNNGYFFINHISATWEPRSPSPQVHLNTILPSEFASLGTSNS